MADSFDFTKTIVNAGKAIGNDLLKATGVGKLSESLRQFTRRGGVTAKGVGKPSFDVNFEGERDYRVKIKVPADYLDAVWIGSKNEIKALSGIVFPYTPQIQQDYTANYTSYNPTHSNYAYHFYKNTQPGNITVTGKFTVQNDSDADMYISTSHMLRSLMKMRFGQDENAGVPPPVCRFSAYGHQQFKDVPVVISSFRAEYPDSVDYYNYAGVAMIPMVSSLSVTMIPVYSREELLNLAHVDDYKGYANLRSRGYL